GARRESNPADALDRRAAPSQHSSGVASHGGGIWNAANYHCASTDQGTLAYNYPRQQHGARSNDGVLADSHAFEFGLAVFPVGILGVRQRDTGTQPGAALEHRVLRYEAS